MSRTETDSLGAIEVPETAYWGAQTQRSIENVDSIELPPAMEMPLTEKARKSALSGWVERGAFEAADDDRFLHGKAS